VLISDTSLILTTILAETALASLYIRDSG